MSTYSSLQQSFKNTRLQIECTVCRILAKVQQEVAGFLLTNCTVKPTKTHWIIKVADSGQGWVGSCIYIVVQRSTAGHGWGLATKGLSRAERAV